MNLERIGPSSDSIEWKSGWVEVWVRGPESNLDFDTVPELATPHPDLYERLFSPPSQRGKTAESMLIGLIHIDPFGHNTSTILGTNKQKKTPRDRTLTLAAHRLFSEFEAGLRALATDIENNPNSSIAKVQYFIGTTRLGSPGLRKIVPNQKEGNRPNPMKRLGFEVYPYPPKPGGDITSASHDRAEHAMKILGMNDREVEKRILRRGTVFVVLTKNNLLSKYGSRPSVAE